MHPISLPVHSPHFATAQDLADVGGSVVAIDTETTGLHWWRERMVGIGFYTLDGRSGFLPTRDSREVHQVRSILCGWPPNTVVVGHNLKFDLHFLGIRSRREAPWADRLIDTTLLIHLYDSRLSKSLQRAAEALLADGSKAQLLRKLGGKRGEIGRRPDWEIAEYCINDCRLALELAQRLAPAIRERGQWGLFRRMVDFLWLLLEVEDRGFWFDGERAAKQRAWLEMVSRQAERRIFQIAGETFDWRSPQQLSRILYQKLGLPRPANPFEPADADGESRPFPTGERMFTSARTNSPILKQFLSSHPIVPEILAARECDKLIDVIDFYLSLADARGWIHPSFNQTGTLTGRLSASDPNVQNMPSSAVFHAVMRDFPQPFLRVLGSEKRVADVLNFRRCIRPDRPGFRVAAIDYKQMEIRMFALLARDGLMLEILRSGRDVHREMAERIWGTAEGGRREQAKAISFGLIYGMGAKGLSLRLGVPLEEASRLVEEYLQRFPGARRMMNRALAKIRSDGYVAYWSGRRWWEGDPARQYRAVNALVQGGCADLLMEAALRVREFLDGAGLDPEEIVIWNFVHDEIDFLYREGQEEILERIRHIMALEDVFGVPFLTDLKTGDSYGDFPE